MEKFTLRNAREFIQIEFEKDLNYESPEGSLHAEWCCAVRRLTIAKL